MKLGKKQKKQKLFRYFCFFQLREQDSNLQPCD